MRQRATSVLLCVVLVASAAVVPVGAQAAEQRHTAAHFGLGVATAAANVIYGPVKVLYAVGGAVVGGLAWALTGGRQDIARGIIQPAVRGDYALTPDNLTMEEPYSFVGRDPEYQAYPSP